MIKKVSSYFESSEPGGFEVAECPKCHQKTYAPYVVKNGYFDKELLTSPDDIRHNKCEHYRTMYFDTQLGDIAEFWV